MAEPDLAVLMARVAAELQAEADEHVTVQTIVARALDVVPAADFASLTIRREGRSFETLAATSEVAVRADEMQYAENEGPCLDAAENVDWVQSGRVATDDRWPAWGRRVAELPVGSLLAVPLLAQGQRIGALNLYSAAEGAFASSDVVDLALLYAVHAAHALSSARLVTGLESALASRHEIGVAQGILMQRFGLDLDGAFALLRRAASQTATKIADIAHEIVQTGKVPAIGQQVDPEEAPEEGTAS